MSSEKWLGREVLGKAELQREPGLYPTPGADMETLGMLGPGPEPSPSIDLGDCPSPAQPRAEMRMGTASEQLGSSPDFRLLINPLARHLTPVSTSFPTCEMGRSVWITYRVDQGSQTLGVRHKGIPIQSPSLSF